jgi:hypothetical protein
VVNIIIELPVTTGVVEGRNNILAPGIEVDRGFADCKGSVEARSGYSLIVEAEYMAAATDRIFVNNGHLQSSLSSLRNEDVLMLQILPQT